MWLLPVLLVTVIATALGALVARSLYAGQESLPPPAIEPSPSSVPPSEQPGSPEVKGTTDATMHPMYRTLRDLLQRHFDAINAKDYRGWVGTVSSQRREQTPEAKWRKDYRSTTDGSIVIYRIEAVGEGSVRALLQLTSVQDVADAPPELQAPCIHWNMVYAFSKERGAWRLAAGSTSSSPIHEACETS